MTHKEFYIWLEGFMTNRSWTVIQQADIEGIQEKMKEVKEVNQPGMFDPNRIPIPVNPFPNTANPTIDPYKPPFEIYCGDKKQLND
jgi:hypothetical protein